MFENKPHGTYRVQEDGSLLREDGTKEVPVFEENSESANWALIDYKWYIKPPQE